MKSTARRQKKIAASSSSSEESTPTCDVASSRAVSQRRSGVPSQQGQFTRKYHAQWKDELSM